MNQMTPAGKPGLMAHGEVITQWNNSYSADSISMAFVLFRLYNT